MVQPEHVPKEFRGPVDVVRKTIQAQGVQGMFKGLGASFMYRSSFVAMFGGTSFSFNSAFCTRRRWGKVLVLGVLLSGECPMQCSEDS